MRYVICHHGIKGQKWGVKNGPPYPLDYSQHNSREKKVNSKSSLDNYVNNNPANKNDTKRREKIHKRTERALKAYRTIHYLDPGNRALRNINRVAKNQAYKFWQTKQNLESGRRTGIQRRGNNVTYKESSKDWARDPVGKDIELKKGRKIYRLVTDKKEKVSDKPYMYVTTNEDDRNIFKGNFINSINGNRKQYEKVMELTKDVKVASKQTQVDAIMKVTGKTEDEARLLVGKMNCELVIDEAARSPHSSEFIKELKNRGYNALLDLNDSGWMGREPVIMLNADDYVITDSVKRVTRKDKGEALDKMSWNFAKQHGVKKPSKIEEKIKDVHYGRQNKNIDLPKNDADAEKKGWRKLSSKESAMHQFHKEGGVENSKWVSPDGHREVVFTGSGKNQHITKDSRDVGTYNYFDPNKNPIGHTVADVIPYIILGNTTDDSTTSASRIGSSIKNFLTKSPDEVTETTKNGKSITKNIIKKKGGK